MQSIHVDVALRQRYLIRIEGREGLQLHKFGLQLAARIPDQSKIHLHEERAGRLIGNPEFRRNRSLRFHAVFWTFHQLPDQFLPVLRHPVEQSPGKEARSLRQPELHMCSACVIDAPQEYLIFIGSKAGVELFSEDGDHYSRISMLRMRPSSIEYTCSTIRSKSIFPVRS